MCHCGGIPDEGGAVGGSTSHSGNVWSGVGFRSVARLRNDSDEGAIVCCNTGRIASFPRGRLCNYARKYHLLHAAFLSEAWTRIRFGPGRSVGLHYRWGTIWTIPSLLPSTRRSG